MKKVILKLAILFAPLVCIAGYNLALDPYAVLRKDLQNQKIEPNNQYLKLDYLLDNPKKYDSFVFGDSRCGHIDVTKIPEGKYYNLYYSGSVPEEWLNNIEYLIQKGFAIKSLLVGLGSHSFIADARSHHRDLLRKPYPQTFDDKLSFYKDYLLAWPNLKIYQIIQNQKNVQSTFYDVYNTGMAVQSFVDEVIEQDPKSHALKFEKWAANIHTTKKGYRIESTLKTIKKIKTLCDQHDIQLNLFIHPSHQSYYLTNNMDKMNEIRRKLSEITDYWDFSGINPITQDSYYYYSDAHYRRIVGDMIISKIYNADIANTPQTFGVYVQRGNVNQHIALRSKELQAQKPNSEIGSNVN